MAAQKARSASADAVPETAAETTSAAETTTATAPSVPDDVAAETRRQLGLRDDAPVVSGAAPAGRTARRST